MIAGDASRNSNANNRNRSSASKKPLPLPLLQTRPLQLEACLRRPTCHHTPAIFLPLQALLLLLNLSLSTVPLRLCRTDQEVLVPPVPSREQKPAVTMRITEDDEERKELGLDKKDKTTVSNLPD